MELPPDPEGMNDDRAEWADIAITAFQHETGTEHADALADLLADLMHWSDRHGYHFASELARAQEHYQEETTPATAAIDAAIDALQSCQCEQPRIGQDGWCMVCGFNPVQS